MFQSKEIGKHRSKKSVLDAIIGRVYITPDNNSYSLISYEKVGNTYYYVYEWVNCSEECKNIISNRLRSKIQLNVVEIMNWITSLKQIINNQ